MALHGSVMVNHIEIAEWIAQRVEPLEDVGGNHLYRGIFILRGEGDLKVTEATVEHRYSDGAAVLAQKVLTLAEGGWE